MTTLSRRGFSLGAVASLGVFAANGIGAAERRSAGSGGFDPDAVEAGAKAFTYVNVLDNDAVSVDVPVGVVNGARPGPTLAVSAGIFATEYCGIEAASRLYRDLDPVAIRGRVIVVPVVNMPGFHFRTPTLNLAHGNNPIDGKSVNTAFPGNPDGTVSEVIAHFVFDSLIRRSNYLVDLRGGDLPESHLVHTMYAKEADDETNRASRDMALACGFRYHQSRGKRPGSLFWESCSIGVPAVITQSGLGYKTQPEEAMIENHVRAVTNVMKHLDMLDGTPERGQEAEELSSEFVVVKAGESGVFHASGEPGDRVAAGDVLGWVTNLDGSTAEEIVSGRDGVLHTYFVRRVVMRGDTVAYVVPLAADGATEGERA